MATTRRGALLVRLAAVTALGALAACGQSPAPSPVSDDLARDLAAARAEGFDLAGGRARGVQIVSAAELTGAAPAVSRVSAPVRATPRRAPRATVRPAAAKPQPAAPSPEPVEAVAIPIPAEAPAPEPVISGPLRTPRPEPTPPAPPGGYKSTGDVIRNAPFPINP